MKKPNKALTDPITFAETFLKILDKGASDHGSGEVERRLVRLKFNPIQKQFLLERGRKNLILKSRQVGISTCIQADMFHQNVTRTVTTATLAHEDETTQKLRRMVNRFYENMPENFRPQRHYSNDRLATYPDFDSEAIIATAGNTNTGRGGTYTRVHCSEFAFFKDAEGILAGILQGGNPSLDLESTPNGAQGYFYELCMQAMDGDNAYKFHFYPWWLDKTYLVPLAADEIITFDQEETALVSKYNLIPEQIKWRREKKKELKHLFYQEYPEDPKKCFLLSGNGYFGDVSHACKIPVGSVTPDAAQHCVAGLDFGQSNDYTVCSVIDKVSKRQVDMLRINRLSWEEMRRQVIVMCKRWNVRMLVAEQNSMGNTNIESMNTEMRAAGCSTNIVPFTTTNLSKSGIMSDLHSAIHEDGLLLLDEPNQQDEIQKMISKQTALGAWQIEAPSGGHDDTVIALALAGYAAGVKPAELSISVAPDFLTNWRG